jgi:hypothetical protein
MTSQALAAFYTQPEPVRSNAHNWLMRLQQSPKAWDVSITLLQSQVASPPTLRSTSPRRLLTWRCARGWFVVRVQSTLEAQMFAASMLQAKIQANWYEWCLPAVVKSNVVDLVVVAAACPGTKYRPQRRRSSYRPCWISSSRRRSSNST